MMWFILITLLEQLVKTQHIIRNLVHPRKSESPISIMPGKDTTKSENLTLYSITKHRAAIHCFASD